MCLLFEIGILIMGILAIARGRVSLSRNRTVTGTPAYVIGALLVATLPMIIGIGMLLGIWFLAQGVPPEQLQRTLLRKAFWVDPVVVATVVITCVVIANIYSGDARDDDSNSASEGESGPTDVEDTLDWIDDARPPR